MAQISKDRLSPDQAPSTQAPNTQAPSAQHPDDPTSKNQQPLHYAQHPQLERWGRSLMRRFGNFSPKIASWLGFQLFATPLRGYNPIPIERTQILAKARQAILHTTIDDRRHQLQVYIWEASHPATNRAPKTEGSGKSQGVAAFPPTVLLMHGWMCTAALMTSFVAPLRQAGFRVIAIDGPAHGDSSGWQTNLRQFGKAIQAVGRQFGPLAGVVGHSFGGAAAVLLQHEHLGQPGTDWERLVLLSSPGETKFMMHVIAQAINVSPQVEVDMQRRFFEHYGTPIEHFSIARLAQGLNLPGLVMHDRDDAMIPFEQGEAIAQSWPNAEFYASEGKGHSDLLHCPQVIQRVRQFLS